MSLVFPLLLKTHGYRQSAAAEAKDQHICSVNMQVVAY